MSDYGGRRVIVCGGREYADAARVFKEMDQLDRESRIGVVIDGMATGADSLGHSWAVERGRAWERHPADWTRHGRAAGIIRNAHMLTRHPDLVVAFPGNRGTADMVNRARLAGVPVIQGR